MSFTRFAPMLVVTAGLIVACGASPDEAFTTFEDEATVASDTSALLRHPPFTAADPCDEDGDGFRSRRCGGNDCCDSDASTHPGQTGFFSMRNACGSFDYNCDGFDEPIANLSVACQAKGMHCTGGGFVTVTPCGVTNTFVDCKWKFGCRMEDSQRIQQCH